MHSIPTQQIKNIELSVFAISCETFCVKFIQYWGVARIFQRGGGVTLGQTLLSWRFLPRNIKGCFLKIGLLRGGGVTGTPGPPLATPLQ